MENADRWEPSAMDAITNESAGAYPREKELCARQSAMPPLAAPVSPKEIAGSKRGDKRLFGFATRAITLPSSEARTASPL